MVYPSRAIYDRNYRFQTNIDAGEGLQRSRLISTRLTDKDFWTNYHDMIEQFEILVRRNDGDNRDLNAISVALDNRMEDVRNTFHDLLVEERVAFHLIAKDLLPVTKHINLEELERNLGTSRANCVACGLPFSRQVQEPPTPGIADYVVCRDRAQQVHSPVRYEECAFVPHQHAFCMREWSRQLMAKDANNNVIGPKEKPNWRCNTCFVDPWRAG